MEQLEKPPVTDPAKTETPPKPGFSKHGKKMGRPTKEALAAEQEAKRQKVIADFSRSLPGVVELPFKAMASKRGEHWLLDKTTSGLLCDSITGMMQAYMPPDMGRYLPVIMFGVVLSGAVSSRLVEDAKLAAQRKAAAEKRRGTDDAGSGKVLGLQLG